MNSFVRHRFTWMLVFLGMPMFAVLGCKTSPPNDSPARVDVSHTEDSTADINHRDTVPASDSLFDNTQPWQIDRTCSGTTVFAPVEDSFAIPSRPGSPDEGKQTATEILGAFDESTTLGDSMIPNENLNPGSSRAYDLYSTDGDVALHLYIVANLSQELLDTYRAHVSVLVDYKPVDATVTHWNDERTEKLNERIGSGINVPFESNVEIFDIVIPASHFSEGRAYEISLAYEANSLESGPFGGSRRFILYRGGYSRPNRPCALASINEVLVGEERQLKARISTNNAILFTDDIEEYEDVDVVHEVQGGESKQFFATLTSSSRPYDGVGFFVPILNGEPQHQGWFIEQPARDSPGETFVDARVSFDITMPESPGVYDVQIASWQDPFEIWRTRDGETIDGVRNSESRVNSNVLRFRVANP